MSPSTYSHDTKKQAIELFLISFVMLFAEIALIRWLSTEARIFAYVNNLVLLSCFLGIGLGCYWSQRKIMLSVTAGSFAILILLIKLPIMVTIQGQELHLFRDAPQLLSAFSDSVIWDKTEAATEYTLTALGIGVTLLIFFIVMVSFIPIGQLLGRLLDRHKNTIVAYSLNVVASIAGVWCFGIFSFLYSPPWVWFAFVAVSLLIMLLLSSEQRKSGYIAIGVLSIAVAVMALAPPKKPEKLQTVWSPYQKLELYPWVFSSTNIQRGYLLNVNNVNYMGLINLSDSFINTHPALYDIADRQYAQNDIPYLFKPGAHDVLILGAGAGNDAAGALRNGATSVDAVEIDPGVVKLGKQYHPEHPYSDSRVSVITDDARSFLKRTAKTYDLISFGLLDAHTVSSSYNNMRIDHYVYTLESFQEARSRLRDDGVLTVTFVALRPWIHDRLYKLLDSTFGFPPLVLSIKNDIYGWGGSMFVTGKDSTVITHVLANNAELKRFTILNRPSPAATGSDIDKLKLTTDDWPYLYLEGSSIPNMHLCIIIILTLLFLVAGKTITTGGRTINFHFFFLGAAFLLLEFQNISKTALLFGSTWLVNSFIISGILILILLANLFVSVVRIRNLKLIYALLIASSLLVYFMPLSLFNFFDFWPKALIVSAFLNLPIFFAGIIFIESFRKVTSKNIAFGSNLLGAAFGGLLESLSFMIGINALLLAVIVLYIVSFLVIKPSESAA